MDETAAWRELEAAVDAALWRYAEVVTGEPRAAADGRSLAARALYMARLRAVTRLRGALDATDRDAGRQLIENGTTYPAVADAAGMSRQAAWRRYRTAR